VLPRYSAFILTLAVLISSAPAAAEETCIADWALATPIMVREKLVTIEQLSPQMRARGAGDIIRSSLCDEKGRYFFRLVVRDQNGKVTNVTVDARRPFAR
jgi:uncharacterized membrane protein YkoI